MKKLLSRQIRRSVSYEAARIMAEEGVRDYRRAKEKACLRIGISSKQCIPTNLEIEDALEEQLAIFRSEEISELRRNYLTVALEVMELAEYYSPRLTGAVLNGAITSSRPAEIHLFADTFEEICSLLEVNSILHAAKDKRFRFTNNYFQMVSGMKFLIEDVQIELLVFLPGTPYPPLSAIDGKPIKRASLKKVRRMLAEEVSG